MTLRSFLKDGRLIDEYEKKAKTDPLYGIALALFELAEAQRETALALDRIGFNEHRPLGSTGALEEIAMQLGARPKFSGNTSADENSDEK